MAVKSKYFDEMHHIGRIGTFISLCFMFGIPIAVCLIFHVIPEWSKVATPSATLLTTYFFQTVSEVFSYGPMLGTASYITFITGNVGNMKLPVALNAMDLTNSSMGTEQGDAVSAIAIAVSSMVTMTVVVIGVILMVPLRPFLTLPEVKIASSNVLPALYGTLFIVYVTNSSVNGYRITNRWVTCIVPMMVVIAFSILVRPINKIVGYTLMCMLPLTCIIGIGLNKIGLVKMIPVPNNTRKSAAQKE